MGNKPDCLPKELGVEVSSATSAVTTCLVIGLVCIVVWLALIFWKVFPPAEKPLGVLTSTPDGWEEEIEDKSWFKSLTF